MMLAETAHLPSTSIISEQIFAKMNKTCILTYRPNVKIFHVVCSTRSDDVHGSMVLENDKWNIMKVFMVP